MILGSVADDFTGATDLAGMLAEGGLRTTLVLGAPAENAAAPDADAVVVAMKTRTIPAGDAVAQSLAAWRWLARSGARQAYFKYCSTFDSTDKGNIGPVAEALWRETDEGPVVFVPSLPLNGRTVYRGHLFVFDQLLSDSGMRNHPLTPMTDSNLVRVLSRQTAVGVGLIRYDTVARGAAAVRAAAEVLAAEGRPFIVVDTLTDADLDVIGEACEGFALVTGGSGLALGLAPRLRPGAVATAATALPAIGGPVVCLSGSCSEATNAQVRNFAANHPVRRLDPIALAEGRDTAADAASWALAKLKDGPCLVSATASPAEVKAVQEKLGTDRAATVVEAALSHVAAELGRAGVRRFVVAGGETSGAVATALGISQLAVGAQIAPGVPWCVASGSVPVAVALKSGNFGGEAFFEQAIATAP
ncbi:MAG: four-carbon acid sugar kinase family protein [Bauldia sp.]|nr:four-carbon acid sugar kinase family protein [Bauldia sp.]